MSRSVPPNLVTILAGPRQIDYTVELTFPDASVLRYATSPLTIGGNVYLNALENVREIRQTLDAAPDRVGVELQNEDRVIGQNVATNWLKWRTAIAVVGRFYQGGANFATSQWVEMFRGGVQQPNIDDRQVTFDILHDTLTPGGIVSRATLNPLCQNVLKDPQTCGYIGAATFCDHHLKSKTGCDGLGNSHRFRGMEHRYNLDQAPPGAAGNNHPINYCVEISNFIKTQFGPRRAGTLLPGDLIWNPVRRKLVPVWAVTTIENIPLWRITTNSGAAGRCSAGHPVICHRAHLNGMRADQIGIRDFVVTEIGGELHDFSEAHSSGFTGELGTVVMITIASEDQGDKIFCFGEEPDEYIVCHNAKPRGIEVD